MSQSPQSSVTSRPPSGLKEKPSRKGSEPTESGTKTFRKRSKDGCSRDRDKIHKKKTHESSNSGFATENGNQGVNSRPTASTSKQDRSALELGQTRRDSKSQLPLKPDFASVARKIRIDDPIINAIDDILDNDKTKENGKASTLPREKKSTDFAGSNPLDSFFSGSSASIAGAVEPSKLVGNLLDAKNNLTPKSSSETLTTNSPGGQPIGADGKLAQQYTRFCTESQPSLVSRMRPVMPGGLCGVRPIYPGMLPRYGPPPAGSYERLCMGAYIPQRFYAVRSPVAIPVSPKKQPLADNERTTVHTQTSFKSPSIPSPSVSQQTISQNADDKLEQPTASKVQSSPSNSAHQEDTTSSPVLRPSSIVPSKPPLTRSVTSKSHPLDPSTSSSPHSPSSLVAYVAPEETENYPHSPSSRKISRKSALFNYDVLKNAFCLSCPPVGLGFTSSCAVKYLPSDDGEVSVLKLSFKLTYPQIQQI